MNPHLVIFVAWRLGQVDFADSVPDDVTNFIRL
jgi:hypothetical protein